MDHETYSFDAARPALERFRDKGIPLILASSKTEAEMLPIAEAMGIDYPLIVENGAGIARHPAATTHQTDDTYAKIRSVLAALPTELKGLFASFGDWDAETVSERTGLPIESARLARMRRFSEPGLWSGTEEQKEAFKALLNDEGLMAVQGGRFFTIMPKTSKAERMRALADWYAETSGSAVRTIALGDAQNDVAMIEAADTGVIVANPAHAPLPPLAGEADGRILRTTKPGPQGWNDIILQIIGP
ncbi:HAD-IIB family hydrolase [Rhizobium sp. NRK18]|nr:HAD-IIB family hydrolase [Rhizobium sp. NRK18]